MKKLTLLLILMCLITQTKASGSGIITLVKILETDTEITYALEAKEIVPELIGISTTIKLPEELIFKKYQTGTFFEEETEDVTYLIATSQSNSQELVIGIVTLGESTARGSGIIVSLTFSKASPAISTTPQILEAKASGVVDEKRTDYDQIVWLTENSLPTTGPFSWENIFILSLVFSLIGFCIKSLFTTSFRKRQGQSP